MTDDTKLAFLKEAYLVKKQYERFVLPANTSQKLNGTLTINENIADILGLQIAFKAYVDNAGDSFQPLPGLEEFTKEQIFFIASTQVSLYTYK